MVQTLTKIFNLNIESNHIQLQVNNEYLDSEKKIVQLKQKVEETEKNNKEYYKKCSEKEKEYQDIISSLEKKMTLIDKADVLMLQKQNNDYEIQIENLNRNIKKTTFKQTQDIEKYSNLIDELTTLKTKLNLELDLTIKTKTQLIDLKNSKSEQNNKTNKQMNEIDTSKEINRYQDFVDNVDVSRELKEKNNNNFKKRKTLFRKK